MRASRIPGVEVFHAATARRGDELVTAGGRVLTVVGRGATFERAIALAYEGVVADLVRRDAVPARHRAEGEAAHG